VPSDGALSRRRWSHLPHCSARARGLTRQVSDRFTSLPRSAPVKTSRPAPTRNALAAFRRRGNCRDSRDRIVRARGTKTPEVARLRPTNTSITARCSACRRGPRIMAARLRHGQATSNSREHGQFHKRPQCETGRPHSKNQFSPTLRRQASRRATDVPRHPDALARAFRSDGEESENLARAGATAPENWPAVPRR